MLGTWMNVWRFTISVFRSAISLLGKLTAAFSLSLVLMTFRVLDFQQIPQRLPQSVILHHISRQKTLAQHAPEFLIPRQTIGPNRFNDVPRPAAEPLADD